MSKETFFSVCNWLIACLVLAICILAFRDLFSTPPKTKYNPAKAASQTSAPAATVPAVPSVTGLGSLSPEPVHSIQNTALGHQKQAEAPGNKKSK